MRPQPITHIITGLGTGGAEMMLFKLLSRLDRNAYAPEVISLTSVGPLGEKIRSLGIPVRSLGMQRGVPNPISILRLVVWLRQRRPVFVQTWMYHADLVGGLAAKLAVGIPVLWGIRQSNLDPVTSKRTTIWTAQLCAKLSRWLPSHIICCSESARIVHAQMGYVPDKMVVIPNGFDLSAFKPDPATRNLVRNQLGIPEDAPVITLVARFDPQKDHQCFVEAAKRFHDFRPDAHFLLCGDGVTGENRELKDWIVAANLQGHVHLLGRRTDVPRIYAATDIATSSSAYGEGFPNVIGEAMACGVPCVVTDVGDSAAIVADTGRVVPPRNPLALANAWMEVLGMNRDALSAAARERVSQNFSLPNVVARFERFYESVTQPEGLT